MSFLALILIHPSPCSSSMSNLQMLTSGFGLVDLSKVKLRFLLIQTCTGIRCVVNGAIF